MDTRASGSGERDRAVAWPTPVRSSVRGPGRRSATGRSTTGRDTRGRPARALAGRRRKASAPRTRQRTGDTQTVASEGERETGHTAPHPEVRQHVTASPTLGRRSSHTVRLLYGGVKNNRAHRDP